MTIQPPLPGYDLARVAKVRDRVVTSAGIHVGTVLRGEYHEDWLLLVAEALPRDVPTKALQLSARSFQDRLLTGENLREFAWRLAGNLRTLREGCPVIAWSHQAEDEWMPLHVAAVQPGRNAKGAQGHRLVFRILAGSACPMKVSRFWTWPQGRYVASLLGYNARAGRPFPGTAHLVGMLLYGLFEPRLSEDRPGFHRVHATGAMISQNVELIAGRKMKPCPTHDYLHDCDDCTVGYDRCRFSLHRATFTTGPCAGCGQPDALFDPDRPEWCVTCTREHHARDDR